MKQKSIYITLTFYVLYAIFALAFIILLVGLIGVIFKVYSPNFIFANLAIFNTLTIDRFIFLFVWFLWSGMCTLCGGLAIRNGMYSENGGKFTIMFLLGVLPYFIGLSYSLFYARAISYIALLLFFLFFQYIIYCIFVISKSTSKQPILDYLCHIANPLDIMILWSPIIFGVLAVIIPFIS